MEPWNATWRTRALPELAARDWDLLLIGGGICGAGILHWLPLALLATAADYRYLNLGILFTVVALLLLIKDVGVARARARDAGAGERTA